MSLCEVQIKGESITFDAGCGLNFTEEWLHFGMYQEMEAWNVAHNLRACFGVSVKVTTGNTDIVLEED